MGSSTVMELALGLHTQVRSVQLSFLCTMAAFVNLSVRLSAARPGALFSIPFLRMFRVPLTAHILLQPPAADCAITVTGRARSPRMCWLLAPQTYSSAMYWRLGGKCIR